MWPWAREGGEVGGEGWAELVQIEATFREMFSSPYRVGNCSSQTVKGDILHKGLEDSERHGFWHLLSHPDSLLLTYRLCESG